MNNLSNHKYIPSNLLRIGPNKPLGYLPISTIKDKKYGGYKNILDDLIDWVNDNGLKYILASEDECSVSSGAIYVYDRTSLSVMLLEYKETLQYAFIPTTPDDYVKYIIGVLVRSEEFPEAYRVIGLTYADERFI